VRSTWKRPAISAAQRQQRERFRILVVEDNATNQKVAVGILEQLGYRGVAVAPDGGQALSALGQSAFDLVLMDCQLPEMDGYETTRLVRRSDTPVHNHQIPIVAMTAHAMEGDRETCLEAGMNDYIAKPIQAAVLEQVLDRWLDATRPGTTAEAISLSLQDHPQAPVFDQDELLARLMGNAYLARRVVNKFLSTTPEQLAALAEALSRFDTKSAWTAAHSIKGAAARMRLIETARRMELLGKAGDLDGVRQLVPELAMQFADYRAEAERPWRNENSGE
jgi:CheY-like chemotaxis protein/HPt (histidine-containing phosphotransfer) domain-containing protein